MNKKPISKLIREGGEVRSPGNRLAYFKALCAQVSQARDIIKLALDPNIKFLLPEGAPPFKSFEGDEGGMLYAETRRLYLFVEGGNPNLTQKKREALFIGLLESLCKEDAELLILMKDKKLYPGITANLIRKAVPGLLSPARDGEEDKEDDA